MLVPHNIVIMVLENVMVHILGACTLCYYTFRVTFGMSCRIMVGLSGNGLSGTWERPWTWPTRTFLNEFDSTWEL